MEGTELNDERDALKALEVLGYKLLKMKYLQKNLLVKFTRRD